MNRKEFKNLPNKYKKLLEDISKLISDEDMKLLSKNKLSFNKVQELYNNIYGILPKYDCDPYDINRLTCYYKKENSIVNTLRMLIYVRNKEIIGMAHKSPLWKENIKNLTKSCNQIFKKCTQKMVENAFVYLLKKYLRDWEGCYTTIEIGGNQNIKNISVFDTEDLDTIFIYIARKSKWENFKDNEQKKRLIECYKKRKK